MTSQRVKMTAAGWAGAKGTVVRTSQVAVGGRGGARYTVALVALTSVTLGMVLALDAGGPQVIRLAATGPSAGTLAESAAADGAAGDASRSWAVSHRFELTDPARFGGGEEVAWRLEPPADLGGATAELASRLGLDAEVTVLPGTEGYQVGADDFSGPVLWVGSMGDWNYHDPTTAPERACVADGEAPDHVEGAEPDDPDVTDGVEPDREPTSVEPTELDAPLEDEDGDWPLIDDVPCEPAAPPSGMPTTEEARRAAESFFAGLGLPASPRIGEVHADEWGAWITASLPVGDRASDLQLSVALGAHAAVTAAHGTLARPVEADRYPTVGAEAAVERLEGEPRWAAAVPEPLVDPDTPVSTDDPVLRPAPQPGDDPADPEGEPEVRTVKLVAAEPVVLLTIDAEQTAWLLPGVRFTDEDGGSWQVLTIADGYLDDGDGDVDPGTEPPPLPTEPQPEPGPAPEPGIPSEERPHGEEPGQVAPGAPAPDTEQAAEDVLGLSEAEAVEYLERDGLTARIVMRDGEGYAVTDDLRMDRVNLVVEEGLVIDAEVG